MIEKFDIRIKVGDKHPYVYTDLSHAQMETLLVLFKAARLPESRWDLMAHLHNAPPTWGARIGAMWRKLNAWAAPLLLLVALSGVATAQEARSLQPIRIETTALGDDDVDKELNRLVRAELRRTAAVVFGAKRVDYAAHFTAGKLDESDKCAGYIAALLVVSADNPPRLSVHTGANLAELARHLAEKFSREFQVKRERE
jgi:hypothetical protein